MHNVKRTDLDGGLELAMPSVKMGWRVIVEEHADQDPVERADCWDFAGPILTAGRITPDKSLVCRRPRVAADFPFALQLSTGAHAVVDGILLRIEIIPIDFDIGLPPVSLLDSEEERLVRVAAYRKTDCSTYFLHSLWSEAPYAPAQALLRDCYRIVKIHRARRLHTVFRVQLDFRRNPSDGGGDRRNRRRGQVPKGTIAGQHYNGPSFVRGSKTVKPNIAPR